MTTVQVSGRPRTLGRPPLPYEANPDLTADKEDCDRKDNMRCAEAQDPEAGPKESFGWLHQFPAGATACRHSQSFFIIWGRHSHSAAGRPPVGHR